MCCVNVLLVVGYGPGVSHATAERFGREGFAVALVSRTRARLDEGADQLRATGIDVGVFPADATDPASLQAAIDEVTAQMGAPTVLLWTAFRAGNVKDVLDTPPAEVERVFDIGVRGLLTSVQALHDGFAKAEGSSVLVVNGALGEPSTEADRFAKYLNNDGVALENAAKTKLVGILAERLRDGGTYVGEVTIAGSVAGTATASPTAIDPALIADTLWSMTTERTATRVRLAEEVFAPPQARA